MSPKDLKTRFDSRFCRMNCQMTVSRLTDARASIWHSAQRRSRELSLWPEFGSISGNLCDLSEAYFAATFLSSNPTTSASQSSLHRLTWEPRSKRHATAAFRVYGLVSVCGIWQRTRDSVPLSPRAVFGVSFLIGPT